MKFCLAREMCSTFCTMADALRTRKTLTKRYEPSTRMVHKQNKEQQQSISAILFIFIAVDLFQFSIWVCVCLRNVNMVKCVSAFSVRPTSLRADADDDVQPQTKDLHNKFT